LYSEFKEARGSFGERFYARYIPGNDKWGAVFNKPELNKKTRKEKASHPTAQCFAELMAETKAIMHNPERKAEWQARYDEAVRKAQKHNSSIQGRLYDYIKHELSEARKNTQTYIETEH